MDGNVQSNEERGAERLMDEHLKTLGLHRKKIAKDGSCLFRAVAEQVLHCQSLHTKVRAKCVEFLKQNRDSYEAFIEGNFEDYLFKLQDPQQWVGEVEINALAVMYKRDFEIFQEPGKPAVNITDNNFKDKVRLCFLNGNHYDSVYPISHIKNAAVCQSILYELLYDGVFRVERGALGSSCQRTARSTDVLIDDNMPACVSSDESDLDTGEALWAENGSNTTAPRHNKGRGRGRFLTDRVRRSLNPTLLRNVAYDVWHKTKRAQQKMDYCIAAGMQFTVGDRCQVRLEGSGRSYNATIKEVAPNNGPVTVYIEEVGKRQVPLWSVRPPNEENSWCTVVNRDKRLSNGHGDWEERGRGRGRGKHTPASSSVSTATAPGSSGRVQKQHSWPPQATVDEQGAAKANRKSVSSVEAAFGLTEQQRLAKEEEERNVALVEIQLRDEHSFPALGTQQSDGGRKKGGEKKRSQRNKTKSPVEDVRASSPSACERPKSSTPPLSATTAAPPASTPSPPPPTSSSPPAAPPTNSDSAPLKTSAPNSNMAAATVCAAPTAKTNAPSYALAAGAPQTSSPAPPPALPPSVPSSASLISLHPPILPAASSPLTSHALSSSPPPPSASSSLPPKSSASPPPSSSLPPPTFIAPIAPSPAAAQGFLPRSSPPVSALPHSPSPPSFTSSSLIHQAAQVHEAPPSSAQTQNIGITQNAPQTFQSQASLPQIHPQVPLPQNQIQIQIQTQTQIQGENQVQAPLPPNQVLMPQMQVEVQSCLPHLQQQPQSHTEVVSLPQTQIQIQTHPAVLQTLLPQAQYLPQSQPEVVQVQASHQAPHTSEASLPVSMQPSVTHPHPHAQPPHPSQVPHPSLSLSSSPSHPSVQSQPPNTQNQTEAPPPPTQHTQPQPDSLAQTPLQQPHPPHPSHHTHLLSAPPPQPPSIPGTVPLQQLSQLYQDPLYPGFPQGEKGEIAPNPPFSSNKSGDDLPRDVNILRFFFNLGVKAYTMPMYPPYAYLFPLQQVYSTQPKLPSPSPSPPQIYPPSNPPVRPQEPYLPAQYPQTSASMPPQYEHQAPLTEPPHPSDPPFNQAAYPVTQPPPPRMPSSLSWQPQQMPRPRNPSFPVGYSTPSPPYPVPPPLTQSFHPSQGSGHPVYRPGVSPYPPSSMGYQSSSAHEELQVSQGAMEQRQPTNGDSMPGQGPSRVPGPAAANLASANNNRAMMVPGFALKKDQGENLTGQVLLVDPPLNNKPILVPNPGNKEIPTSMTTMNTRNTPGSPVTFDVIKTTIHGDNNPSRVYRGHQKRLNPTNTYVPLGAPEPSPGGYLAPTPEALSVGCSTEDDWEESYGIKPMTFNQRPPRRGYRGGGAGGRGRGGHDPGRGAHRRRQGGEVGQGLVYTQYFPSHRGRGRERGY